MIEYAAGLSPRTEVHTHSGDDERCERPRATTTMERGISKRRGEGAGESLTRWCVGR